jgi:hypothetical protein
MTYPAIINYRCMDFYHQEKIGKRKTFTIINMIKSSFYLQEQERKANVVSNQLKKPKVRKMRLRNFFEVATCLHSGRFLPKKSRLTNQHWIARMQTNRNQTYYRYGLENPTVLKLSLRNFFKLLSQWHISSKKVQI